jgi:hypothetical protein
MIDIISTEQTNQEDLTKWRPTEAMRQAVGRCISATVIIPADEKHRKEFAEVTGLHESTFRKWLRDPWFAEWWGESMGHFFEIPIRKFVASLPEVLNAISKAAIDPDGTAADRKLAIEKIEDHLTKYLPDLVPERRAEIEISLVPKDARLLDIPEQGALQMPKEPKAGK